MSRTRAMHDRSYEPDDLEDRPTRPIEPDTLCEDDAVRRRTTTIELGIDRNASSVVDDSHETAAHPARIEPGIDRNVSSSVRDPKIRSTQRTATIELGIDRNAESVVDDLHATAARPTRRTATSELGIDRNAASVVDDSHATAARPTRSTAPTGLAIERETAPLVPGDLSPRGRAPGTSKRTSAIARPPVPRTPIADPRGAGRGSGAAAPRGGISDLEVAYARIRALEHEVRRDELGRAQTRILSLQRKVIRARAHARTATAAAPVIALIGFALTLAGGSILIADDPSPHMTGGIIACLGTLLAFAAGYAMFATPSTP